MTNNLKYYLLLQLVVLIAGFTGILGDLITLPAEHVTFYRTAIAVISLFPFLFFLKGQNRLRFKQIIILLGTGVIVGLHWFTFFYSIKCSSISIAVICLATATLFMAFIEPIVRKRSIRKSELILSIIIIIGMVLIYGYESDQIEGIIFGVMSAFLATLFTAFNGNFIRTMPSIKITFYEMIGACFTMTFILYYQNNLNSEFLNLDIANTIYLLILGIICTSLAFILSVYVMKRLSPFTVSISLNLEPIYTIIIALIIDWYTGTTKEQMSLGFYFGGSIILTAIFINAILKKRAKSII